MREKKNRDAKIQNGRYDRQERLDRKPSQSTRIDIWKGCEDCSAKGNYEYCKHLLESEECPKQKE